MQHCGEGSEDSTVGRAVRTALWEGSEDSTVGRAVRAALWGGQ